MICIGVTQNADMAQLQSIATREEYAVQVESYSTLNQLSDIITQQNLCTTQGTYTVQKSQYNHHANLPLEMYSFTLSPPSKHLETTGADDPTL